MPKQQKFIFSFGGGKAEGNAKMRDLLGGKGAGLHEMTRIGAPVPPGFTITTDVCTYYYAHRRQYPKGLESEVRGALTRVEKILDRVSEIARGLCWSRSAQALENRCPA